MLNPLKIALGLLVLWLNMQPPAHGQLSLFQRFNAVNHDALTVYYATDTSTSRTYARYRQIAPQMKRWQGERFALSKTNQMLWLSIRLRDLPSEWQTQYVVVRNPHINYLNAWLLQHDSLVLTFPATGDKLPYSTRELNQTDFGFELPAASFSDNYRLILAIDKRYEVTHVPVHFFSQQGLFALGRTRGILFGAMMSMMLFIMLFSLFLFINMREWLYICYGLFIFFSLFYQFSDAGFAFMYFYPNRPFFTDFARPLSASLSTIFYLLFLMLLLDMRKHWPRLYKAQLYFLGLFALVHMISLPLLPSAESMRAPMHSVWALLGMVLIAKSLTLCVLALYQRVPYARHALLSVMVLVGFSMMYSLFNAGMLADTWFTRNLYLIGVTINIVVLTLMLSIRFRRYKDASEHLVVVEQQRQEEIFKAVTDYREKELERLSHLLHDAAGARLSAIRLNLEQAVSHKQPAAAMKSSIAQIAMVANTIRDLSHALSPVLLEQKSLSENIREYVDFINESGQLRIQLDWMEETNELPYRYKLMTNSILQELIQNILKHAGATEAIVQVICTEEIVSIFVEDNGRGFHPENRMKGLGLLQIDKLLHLSHGRFDIKNKPEGGATVSIEFEVKPSM